MFLFSLPRMPPCLTTRCKRCCGGHSSRFCNRYYITSSKITIDWTSLVIGPINTKMSVCLFVCSRFSWPFRNILLLLLLLPWADGLSLEYIIQSGAKKKNVTFSKSIFSYLYLSKYTLLCIKLNTFGWTSWWWKLYLNIFYNEHFIVLWNWPSKNTSHKKRQIQGKRRLLITF